MMSPMEGVVYSIIYSLLNVDHVVFGCRQFPDVHDNWTEGELEWVEKQFKRAHNADDSYSVHILHHLCHYGERWRDGRTFTWIVRTQARALLGFRVFQGFDFGHLNEAMKCAEKAKPFMRTLWSAEVELLRFRFKEASFFILNLDSMRSVLQQMVDDWESHDVNSTVEIPEVIGGNCIPMPMEVDMP